jgi:hypothetical protein
MKTVSFRFVFLLILVALGAHLALAQPSGPRAVEDFPFAVGESLTFEGKINKFAVSVTIGDMTLEVVEATNDGRLQLKADARSRGTMLKLFRYSFLQQIDSFTDARDLRSFSTKKHDVQKQKIRDSLATFDYPDRKVTWIETNPAEPLKPPRTIASDLDGRTHDIVSALYLIRTLPMSVGYRTIFNVSDSGLVYKIPVRVAARERQKTIFGDIWCYRIEPDVFGPGRFFEQDGKMEIWITDDARRIPVRARVNAEVGKVDVRLKSTKNLK